MFTWVQRSTRVERSTGLKRSTQVERSRLNCNNDSEYFPKYQIKFCFSCVAGVVFGDGDIIWNPQMGSQVQWIPRNPDIDAAGAAAASAAWQYHNMYFIMYYMAAAQE